MPVHIEEMNVDMQVAAGELPLTEAQIELLVKLILSRLARAEREAGRIREATTLRTRAAPTLPISD